MKRIAIVNRGECALRFLRGLADYNAKHNDSIVGIALVTPADRSSMMAQLAGERVELEVRFGEPASRAYIDHDRVMDALDSARADAVWVGWGFLAEDPEFAKRVIASGRVFIGPKPEAMRLAGDKIAAKKLAQEAGVPVVPWSEEPLGSLEDARAHAQRIGFPVVLKAAAGGGGRGIRRVDELSELDEAFDSASREALAAFGDGRMFVERCIDRARHLEVQLVRDAHHTAVTYGVRDCTVQRRHQKVLEEAPGPHTDDALVALLEGYAKKLAHACDYQNVGTVEFIYDLDTSEPYFMEINTRLQVEHPITELIYGVDLVQTQLMVAAGHKLDDNVAPPRGYAIEARLNAEDVDRDFSAAPGRVQTFAPALGPGVRVDSGVDPGSEISPDFDSMIAKVIAYGRDRSDAMARLLRALKETKVIVKEGATNKSLLCQLLRHPDVQSGNVTTRWLDYEHAAGTFKNKPGQTEALLVAAIVSFHEAARAEREAYFATLSRGLPQHPPKPLAVDTHLSLGGQNVRTHVRQLGHDVYDVRVGDTSTRVCSVSESKDTLRLTLGSVEHRVVFASDPQGYTIEIDGIAHRVGRDDGGVVSAPAPAVVMSVAVAQGDVVEEGQRLASLEAMKMETPLRAPRAGKVVRVFAAPSTQVVAGTPLFEIEAAETAGAGNSELPLDLPHEPSPFLKWLRGTAPASELDPNCFVQEAWLLDLLRELRAVILGYTYDPHWTERALEAFDVVPWGVGETREHADAIANMVEQFADIDRLFQSQTRRSGTESYSNISLFYRSSFRLHHGRELDDDAFTRLLDRALGHLGASCKSTGKELDVALTQLAMNRAVEASDNPPRRMIVSALLRALIRLYEAGVDFSHRANLERAILAATTLAGSKARYLADNAQQTRYVLFHQARFERRAKDVEKSVEDGLAFLASCSEEEKRQELVHELTCIPESVSHLVGPVVFEGGSQSLGALEVFLRRNYHAATIDTLDLHGEAVFPWAHAKLGVQSGRHHVLMVFAPRDKLVGALQSLPLQEYPNAAVDLVVQGNGEELASAKIEQALRAADVVAHAKRVTLIELGSQRVASYRTWAAGADGACHEVTSLRGFHPEMERRMELWRLSDFNLERLESHEHLLVFRGVSRVNEQDERIFILGEVRNLPMAMTQKEVRNLPGFEHAFLEAVRTLREIQAQRPARKRYMWNRITLFVRPSIRMDLDAAREMAKRLEVYSYGLELECVVVRLRIVQPDDSLRDVELKISNVTGHHLEVEARDPSRAPIVSATGYERNVQKARSLGVNYPYEAIRVLTAHPGSAAASERALPPGRFVEYDLVEAEGDVAKPVERPPGRNSCGVVFGIIQHDTERYPDGLDRVMVLSDPLYGMGALSEPECRRILCALDMAEARGIPVEWLPISSGALISMDSGTENLDWTAHVLRRIVEFTQAGGEINVIVDGINVGAQSYFNAEATMLMHTRGILVMTLRGAMVLTGKKALDYSGSMSAADERGIGGYERVMGPNGQAQFYANDLLDAYRVLLEHYRYTYVKDGETAPRPAKTVDVPTRDVCDTPYLGDGFDTLGEIFSAQHNAERKKPFAMRELMAAVVDKDAGHLEYFKGMSHAETAIAWNSFLGGHAVTVIGIESQALSRKGHIPGDGPDSWSGATLYPLSSKKVARALNQASGRRPAVVLANLSGFDGSPESMRRLQLEFGAEIGRAVVNFKGPIIFCVVGRYHGGAYVVFSKALNDDLKSIALEGSFASVIGGAPAAAVVFARDVRNKTLADVRIVKATEKIRKAPRSQQARLREEYAELYKQVQTEYQREFATQFDSIHTVQRAKEVGSLDDVISPHQLRASLIEAIGAPAAQRSKSRGPSQGRKALH